nr:hypothetical protein [uncultured Desulfobulbus sp.]
MFEFIDNMVNAVKRPMFNRLMSEVRNDIKTAWKFIKFADEKYDEGDIEKASNCIRITSEALFDAFKNLKIATSNVNMPKGDFSALNEILEEIMKLGDPMMYDYIYPGFRFVHEFKSEYIQKEWDEEVQKFFKYSKKLIPYEELLRKYPYSSALKDYNKNSGQG